MKVKTRYVTAEEQSAKDVEFEVNGSTTEDAMNDLIDQWYTYCWNNDLLNAKIAYVQVA